MDVVYNVAFILVLVGAINWGLVGLIQFDLVAALLAGGGKFGTISIISRIVYFLVGISAVYIATQYFLLM